MPYNRPIYAQSAGERLPRGTQSYGTPALSAFAGLFLFLCSGLFLWRRHRALGFTIMCTREQGPVRMSRGHVMIPIISQSAKERTGQFTNILTSDIIDSMIAEVPSQVPGQADNLRYGK